VLGGRGGYGSGFSICQRIYSFNTTNKVSLQSLSPTRCDTYLVILHSFTAISEIMPIFTNLIHTIVFDDPLRGITNGMTGISTKLHILNT